MKTAARNLGLPTEQPERINTEPVIDRVRAASPDVIVVAAYGQMLKPNLFGIPPNGTINIHASLLPAYRGAAPVQWALVRGERTTGITTFLIDRGMDTGDLLLLRDLEIGPDETAGELGTRLAELGAAVLLETLDGISSGTIVPRPQPADGVTFAPMLTRDDGRIDWSASASDVHNLIRGTSPWPGAWTILRQERIKVHRSVRTGVLKGSVEPGEIALPETGRLLVGCSDELIELVGLQREGRPRVDGDAFLNGLRSARRFI